MKDRTESNKGVERGRPFVVADRDSAMALELGKEVFHMVPVAVAVFVEGSLFDPFRLTPRHGKMSFSISMARKASES